MKKRNMILVIIMMFALAGCASLDEEVKKDSANTITKRDGRNMESGYSRYA